MKKPANIKTSGDLADAIIEDIRNRDLKIGDRYLTAKEIGDQFSVSTVTAHRAMVALSEANVVIRKRKSGTFVGPGFIKDPDLDSDNIHVLHVIMDKAYSKNFPEVYEVFNDVADDVLGDSLVEFHMVPERDTHMMTKRLISQIENSDYNEAVVLIRSTERTQRLLQASNIKTVIFGSSFPGIELPSLDADQLKSGELITEGMIEEKCSHFLLVMYNSWRQGDNVLFNSISATLGKAGYPMGTLAIHNAPIDLSLASQDIVKEISQIEGRAGIITRSHSQADEVKELMAGTGVEFSLGCCDNSPNKKPGYFYLTPALNYKQQVKKVINALIDEDGKTNHLVDVKLKS